MIGPLPKEPDMGTGPTGAGRIFVPMDQKRDGPRRARQRLGQRASQRLGRAMEPDGAVIDVDLQKRHGVVSTAYGVLARSRRYDAWVKRVLRLRDGLDAPRATP